MKITLLILIAIIGSIFPNSPASSAKAVNPSLRCVVGRNAAPVGFWTWPANSQVNIYLRTGDFSELDVVAVKSAARNWDLSATENGSHVRFTVHGLTAETKTGRGDMTLVRGKVYDRKLRHFALLEAHSLRDNRMIDYALIIVDFKVKNPDVLTNVTAHELGHSLGLLDCFECSGNTTAMGLMKASCESNGIEGPSACDKVGVVEVYEGLRKRGDAAAEALRLASVADQGEEPEADDTPIVIRP